MENQLRIGQINYSNTLPVYLYFHPERFGDRIRVFPQVPAQLNRAMAAGEIDVGPISSFSYAEHADEYLTLPELSVSADGKVGSIFLFSKKTITELNGAYVSLTNTSATSVNLLKIILQQFIGLTVHYSMESPNLETMMAHSDACLLIGDDALLAYRENKRYHVYDLGELWKEHTGYPMTFAVWAVRRDAIIRHPDLLREVHAVFLESKRQSLANMDKLAKGAIERYGGDMEAWVHYFRGLQYDYTALHREGLEHYYRCAYELGLLPKPVKVALWDGAGTVNI